MSNKFKKIRNKKEPEFNSINDYYQDDELNLQNNGNKNKYISYENQINILEENENIEQKEKSYNIEDILSNNNNKEIEINDQLNLNSNHLTEEDENININNNHNDELPLITLNFISICQCCKHKFDNINNLPYLLKCGHFFCINCIKQYFTDETGIMCPSDGLVAKSINELKLLKNLIIEPKKSIINNSNYQNNTYEQNDSVNNIINNNNDNKFLMNFCPIHKNQQLSHIINDTNEIICVHCAFERLKSNPNLDIKEIKEKYKEYNNNLETIIINGQKNIELIEHTLELISKNRENEEKKLNIFYNNIIKFLESQKKEKMEQIQNIFKENTHDLEQKLLIFNEIIEQGKDLQKILEKEDENISQNYSKVINNYNNILKLNKSNNDDTLNNKLKYIKFTNENELDIKEYLRKISNLNIIYRIIKFIKNGKASRKDNNSKNKNQYKKVEKQTNDKIKASIKYNKNIPNRKNIINNNIKNISNENIYDSYVNYNSCKKDRFINKNNSVNLKENNYFVQGPFNNNILKNNIYRNKANNSTKNTNFAKKAPILKVQYEEKLPNKKYIRENKSNFNNNSLLESYFELKTKEKSLSLKNNYDSFSSGERRYDSQKNSNSFNNLNILNNFYNLEYSKNSPTNIKNKKEIIRDFQRNNNYDTNKIKIFNESFNKLMPRQFNQFTKTFNFQ